MKAPNVIARRPTVRVRRGIAIILRLVDRYLRRGVATTGILSIGFLSPSPAAQTPTFRSATHTVFVYATVRDQQGRLVPGLTREDFNILDNGRAMDVDVFSSEPEPLSLALMLDMGMSVSWGEFDLRGAVLSFVTALDQRDRIRVGSFGLEITLGANLTNDRGEVTRVLDEEIWKGGGTPLWQAVRAAMDSLAGEPGRRVVLVETRGRDSGTLPGFADGETGAESQAVHQECMVYAILFQNTRDSVISPEMVRLTEISGRGYLVVRPDGDLAMTMSLLAEELRHQYLLGFVRLTLDGTVHSLEVHVRKAGLKASARKNYLARNGS